MEAMVKASRKSQQKNSFYFILWGLLMAAVSIIEYYCAINHINIWQIWPIAGISGGLLSYLHGQKERKKSEVNTTTDLFSKYLWGAFGITLVFMVAYSIPNRLHPHPLILAIAGLATFVSGGVSKFKPLILGGISLWIGALVCTFVVTDVRISIVYAIALIAGYVIPGFILRKKERDEAR
jgi:hypothetical protein|tara:strand:- start:1552 stop:2091 length:540 start_codon:yes stop_codon:yes gene_type:complete